LKRNTAVSESRAVTLAMCARIGADDELTWGSVYAWNVNATSPAVTGAPSCQRARGSRWNISVIESRHSQRMASWGTNPRSPTVFSVMPMSASFKKIWSWMSRDSAETLTGGSRMSGVPPAAKTSVPQ